MKTEKLNIYNTNVDNPVSNEYPTPKTSFRQPALHMIVGVRNTGKSYLTSKILAQAKKDKTFNRIYIITPSFLSNRAYFGDYINEEDVYEPTKDAINNVIQEVETDRDLFEEYLMKKELYKQFSKDIKSRKPMIDESLELYNECGFLDNPEKPEWKYEKEEPPKSLLILDDCLGSPAILQSSGLTKCATLNRHLAPLKEPHSGRSACGLAVIILSQTYKMNNGFSRCLRENLSLLTLFKNKQDKQIDCIKEELANVIDIDLFDEAYEYATKNKYGNLSVDFKPRCNTLTFRKNLNEIIKFDKLPCECKK
jgi:hypothetical protein